MGEGVTEEGSFAPPARAVVTWRDSIGRNIVTTWQRGDAPQRDAAVTECDGRAVMTGARGRGANDVQLRHNQLLSLHEVQVSGFWEPVSHT